MWVPSFRNAGCENLSMKYMNSLCAFCQQVKLVNIRNDDITDGNPKLTLGLIWTIILHFQVSVFISWFMLHQGGLTYEVLSVPCVLCCYWSYANLTCLFQRRLYLHVLCDVGILSISDIFLQRNFRVFFISELQKCFTCFRPDLYQSLSLNLQIITWVYVSLHTHPPSLMGFSTSDHKVSKLCRVTSGWLTAVSLSED